MQSKDFNLKYAQSIPALSNKLAAAQADGPDGIVNLLVTYSDYDFGSAAWFLTSQCKPGVLDGLKTAGKDGFDAYLDCIGTTAVDDQTAYYNRALAALGVRSS